MMMKRKTICALTCMVAAVFSVSIARDGTKQSVVTVTREQVSSFLGGKGAVMVWRSDGTTPKRMDYVDFNESQPVVKTLFEWAADRYAYGIPDLTVDGTRVIYFDASDSSLYIMRISDKAKRKVLDRISGAAHIVQNGTEYLYYTNNSSSLTTDKRGIYRLKLKNGIEPDGTPEFYHPSRKGGFFSYDMRWAGYNFGGSSGPPYVYDLVNNVEHQIPYTSQRCQGSIAYGNNPYRIAHMQLPHTTYHFYNWSESTKKWTKWKTIGKPSKYYEINFGVFSVNHPDYHYTSGLLTTPSKSADYLITNIQTGQMLTVVELAGSYDRPYTGDLYIGSTGPQLTLNKGQIEFAYTVGTSTPPAQTLTVGTSQGTLGAVTVSEDVSWLTTSVSGGTVTNSVVTADMAQGTYTTTVKVSVAGSGQTSYIVKFIVSGATVFSSVVVTPSPAFVAPGAKVQFLAQALDQEKRPIEPAPVFSWKVSAEGTVDSKGLFTASAALGGPFTVTATGTVGGVTRSGTATLTVADVVADTLQLIEPSGGETFTVGDSMSVRWRADTAFVGDVEIYLLIGRSQLLVTTDKSVSVGDRQWGDFRWLIPAALDDNSVVSDSVRIMIRLYGGGFERTSGYVRISAKSLAIQQAMLPRASRLVNFERDGSVSITGEGRHAIRLLDLHGRVLFRSSGDSPRRYEIPGMVAGKTCILDCYIGEKRSSVRFVRPRTSD